MRRSRQQPKGADNGHRVFLSAVTGSRCILVVWAEKWHQSSPLAKRRRKLYRVMAGVKRTSMSYIEWA